MREACLGIKHTYKVKLNMSESRKDLNKPFYGKSHNKKYLIVMKTAVLNRLKSPVISLKVEITDQ